jgi:hypothetical protein
MKHTSSRVLFDYWNDRRGSRPMPERGEIEPGDIRHVLADTFILAFEPQAVPAFRIAGTRVCAIFGRELKSESFIDLWKPESHRLVRDLLTVVTQESIGAVAGASGRNSEGATLDFELVLLPLSHRGRTGDRVLGALAPTELPDWFGTSTMGRLGFGTLRYLGPEVVAVEAPPMLPVMPRGRIRHGLLVYDGGQS